MKKLLNIILVSTLLGCDSNDIEGTWKVVGTSGDSICMVGNGDLIFKPGYEVTFKESKMTIRSSNSIDLEEYNYELSNDDLFIFYSDYGIPISLEPKNKNEIYLYGGGFGNSIEEQSKGYFLIVLRTK